MRLESKRFRCVTFGCRVNLYETQSIREQLSQAGLSEAVEGEAADFVVVNSCTVTAEADRQCLAELRSLHRQQPEARILVTGCLVQRDSGLLSGLPGVKVLAGSAQKHRIGDWVREMLESKQEYQVPKVPGTPVLDLELSRVYGPLGISRFDGWDKAFVKVQDGCDRACAFCKIPLVRGRSRSRSLADIEEEVLRLVEAAGYRELALTGIAIGLWGREWEPPQRLAGLVRAVDRLPGRFRARLSSLDPRDLDAPLIEALSSSSKFCRHLHLSLQSGSDPVLARMNRGHTTAEYAARVASLRRAWPDLGLTTDLIAGFPGETEREFLETLEFCRSMEFAKVHVFPYSRRRGTTASLLKGENPPAVVKERAARLRQTAEETAGRFRERFIGTTQEVLVEKGGMGYTSQYLRVVLGKKEAAGRAGELAPVRLTGLAVGGLKGEIFAVATLTN